MYLRLSKDDLRVGESLSIENQRLLLSRYIEVQGFRLVDTYVDDGYSGTHFNRPGFIRMIEDAKDGRINTILVKDLSRFGRDHIGFGQYTDYLFPALGVRFIALNDGVDTAQSDNDIMPFRNLFNEFASKDTSKKIKAVKQARAKNGEYLGCYAPYGYDKAPEDKHRFVVDEEAARVVRRIFDWRRQGHGFRKIAGLLNDEHILPPRDHYYKKRGKSNPHYSNHRWNDVTIRVIVRNEVYIGNMVQMKTGTLSYKNHKMVVKPKDNWIRIEGTHEAIIDRETWDTVQELDRKRYKPRRAGNGEVSLFGGLLRCMDCGFAMRYQQETHIYPKKGRTVYKSYLCGNYSRSGKGTCSTHSIYLNPLKELVLDDIRRHALRVGQDAHSVAEEIAGLRDAEDEKARRAERKVLTATTKRLSELETLTRSLYEDKVRGIVPEHVFSTLISEYEAEREEKAALAAELEAKQSADEREKQDTERWMEAIRKYAEIPELTREILLELVDKIEIGERAVVDGQKVRDIRIHYKFVGNIG
ncbi:recombinase family protein [Oscillospiraceae bacterium OttesenSCG-928-F05]|nr:recombinase family protein [Oscillospiraceae bacterium OttesenSCG-928-F05]